MNASPDMLAAMGINGDDSLAHVQTGELIIPPGVLPPDLYQAVIQAMQIAGQPPETFMVGSGEEQVNPNTDMPMFAYIGAGEQGSRRRSSSGQRNVGPREERALIDNRWNDRSQAVQQGRAQDRQAGWNDSAAARQRAAAEQAHREAVARQRAAEESRVRTESRTRATAPQTSRFSGATAKPPSSAARPGKPQSSVTPAAAAPKATIERRGPDRKPVIGGISFSGSGRRGGFNPYSERLSFLGLAPGSVPNAESVLQGQVGDKVTEDFALGFSPSNAVADAFGLALGVPGGAQLGHQLGMSGDDWIALGGPNNFGTGFDRQSNFRDRRAAEREIMEQRGGATRQDIGSTPAAPPAAQQPPAAPPGPEFTRPGIGNRPGFIPANMTPLQMRAMIATYGTQGEDSQFRSPEAYAFYDNLLRNALITDQGGLLGTENLLPIELQFLTQTRGMQHPSDTRALLAALTS